MIEESKSELIFNQIILNIDTTSIAQTQEWRKQVKAEHLSGTAITILITKTKNEESELWKIFLVHSS